MRTKPAAHQSDRGGPDRSRAGLAAIEAALILPVLLLLATGLFDLGFAAYEAMQVQSAADAGAHYASKNTWNTTNTTAIQAAVTGATGGGISASPVPIQFCACPVSGTLATVTCTSVCANGDTPSLYVRVYAQRLHSPVLSYPGLPKPLTLKAEAVARMP